MDRNNNMRFFVLGALLSVVAAGGYAPAISAPVYAAPRVALPLAAPAYSAAISTYKQEIIHPAPRAVEYITSYAAPAPVLRAAPVVSSSYSYATPQPIPLLKSYAVPAPVYQAPTPVVASSYSYATPQPTPVLKSYAVPAAPVYAAPRIETVIPTSPVLSSYAYTSPAVSRIEVPLARFAAQTTPLLREYTPIAPHTRYGLPQL